MTVTVDLVWMLCPSFLLIGAFLGAILTLEIVRENGKKMIRVEKTVKAREWSTAIAPMLDAGWICEGVTPADVNGFVDVHLARRM
jgi:hypothetical protein